MVPLAFVVANHVGGRKYYTNNAHVDPEELKGEEVNESEECPNCRSYIEASPEHEGVSGPHLGGVLAALKDPFFRSVFIEFTPPSEVD